MLKLVKNEKGVLFPIAIVLLFVVTSCIAHYVISFESQIRIYNSLESANVRATINLLNEIGSN